MLLDEIKQRAAASGKTGDTVARDILRLALGEAQTIAARNGVDSLGEDDVANVVRRLVKSNEETIALAPDDANVATLRHEIEVLASLLPASLSIDEIVQQLTGEQAAIQAAKNEGQAIGTAMKALKAIGAVVSGQDVAAAVKRLRS